MKQTLPRLAALLLAPVAALNGAGSPSGKPIGLCAEDWYPTWAENDILYSPWTDGKTRRLDGYTDWSQTTA